MKKIISIILMLFLVFSLAGCGSVGPDKTVTGYLDAAKSLDVEKMMSYFDGDEGAIDELIDSEDMPDEILNEVMEVFKPYTAKTTYEVLETKEDGDKATVKVKCKYIDGTAYGEAVIGEYIANAFGAIFAGNDVSDEEAYEMLSAAFKNNTDKFGDEYAETEVEFGLEKVEDEWKIRSVSDSMGDVILLNFAKASVDLQ